MMGRYEELKKFLAKLFRRSTAVQRETFEKMVEISVKTQSKRYRNAGRKVAYAKKINF